MVPLWRGVLLAIRSWSQAWVGGRSLVPWLQRMVGAMVRGEGCGGGGGAPRGTVATVLVPWGAVV